MAAVISGCFYTEVINLPPRARIERVNPQGQVLIRGMVDLTARTSADENGDALTYDWTCAPCSSLGNGLREFRVVVANHDPIRVNLQVTDEHGAFSTATTELQVQNRAPAVKIQAQTPQGAPKVTQDITFLADGNDPDGDRLSYQFNVYPPEGSPATFQFMRESATSYTLVPDAPGTWEVQVTVDDGFGGRTTGSRMVTVAPDSPPCIAATSPTWTPDARVILLRAGGPRRFAVDSIIDDLDPWPGTSNVHFRWLVGPLDAPVEIAGHDLPELVIDPSEMDPGEELGVRVEIADRTPRMLPCDARQAVCPTVECAQRLTWTAEVR